MKKQILLFKDTNIEQKKINLAGGLDIIIEEEPYPKATLYRQGFVTTDLIPSHFHRYRIQPVLSSSFASIEIIQLYIL